MSDELRLIGARYERQERGWVITYEVVDYATRFDGGGVVEIVREVERRKIGKPTPSETK